MPLMPFILAAVVTGAPAEEATKVLPPADLASYVTQADYPASALKNREQGSTTFRVAINTQGRVRACTILATSGSATLDRTTCELMRKRLRFRPARDSNGRAAEDEYDGTIHWRLPEAPAV